MMKRLCIVTYILMQSASSMLQAINLPKIGDADYALSSLEISELPEIHYKKLVSMHEVRDNLLKAELKSKKKYEKISRAGELGAWAGRAACLKCWHSLACSETFRGMPELTQIFCVLTPLALPWLGSYIGKLLGPVDVAVSDHRCFETYSYDLYNYCEDRLKAYKKLPLGKGKGFAAHFKDLASGVKDKEAGTSSNHFEDLKKEHPKFVQVLETDADFAQFAKLIKEDPQLCHGVNARLYLGVIRDAYSYLWTLYRMYEDIARDDSMFKEKCELRMKEILAIQANGLKGQ